MKDEVNGPTNSSYSVHRPQNEFDRNKFKGVKFRYTNGLLDCGHMAPVWMQVPGCSDEEMPSDKCESGVVVLEIEGLSADGGINLDSKSVGYVVFIRNSAGSAGTDTECFKEYEKRCRQPTADASAIRKTVTALGFTILYQTP